MNSDGDEKGSVISEEIEQYETRNPICRQFQRVGLVVGVGLSAVHGASVTGEIPGRLA